MTMLSFADDVQRCSAPGGRAPRRPRQRPSCAGTSRRGRCELREFEAAARGTLRCTRRPREERRRGVENERRRPRIWRREPAFGGRETAPGAGRREARQRILRLRFSRSSGSCSTPEVKGEAGQDAKKLKDDAPGTPPSSVFSRTR